MVLDVNYFSLNSKTVQRMDTVWTYTFKNLNPNETYKLKLVVVVPLFVAIFDNDVAFAGITFGNIYPINQMAGWGSNLGIYFNGSANLRPTTDTYNSEHICFYDIPQNSDSFEIEFYDFQFPFLGSLEFEIINQNDIVLWSPGSETDTSITVQPSATTTYTVDVARGNTTCQSDVTLTVNQRDFITCKFYSL